MYMKASRKNRDFKNHKRSYYKFERKLSTIKVVLKIGVESF
jgi:hypothetical protein